MATTYKRNRLEEEHPNHRWSRGLAEEEETNPLFDPFSASLSTGTTPM
jgi:hypothetical protein